MHQLLRSSQSRSVPLSLKRDLRRQLLRGHPWLFSQAVHLPDGLKPGQRALLTDKKGPLGMGFVDPESPLVFRMCALGTKASLNDHWAQATLEKAATLRARSLPPQTDGFRLVNGEGDGLPGLVVDLYGKSGVVRFDGTGAREFYNPEGIASWIMERFDLHHVLEKKRGSHATPLAGSAPTANVQFKENGLVFEADLIRGQKTGFFLDQRDNRAHIQRMSQNQDVLNLFSYTGGFSLYAASGEASHVTSVDQARPAIKLADRLFSLNGQTTPHSGVAGDVFDFLESAHAEKRQWDLVIVDPPSFAPSEKAVPQAVSAYTRVFTMAAKVCRPGGYLALASCSSHITDGHFEEIAQNAIGKARRRACVLFKGGQPIDHPYPLACPELKYLKFLGLRLVD